MLTGHPIFWILVVAVAAPLPAEISLSFKVPVVVLGIAIGPHVLKLVLFEGFLVNMFDIGMAMTLFMAGMELEFSKIKGRPLSLATGGWIVSALLGLPLWNSSMSSSRWRYHE